MHRILTALMMAAVAFTLVFIGAPADAAARYSVTAVASLAAADVGQSVTLKGKVTPKAAGQRVKVQRWSGAGWTTVKRPVLNRHSRYHASITITAPGDNRYRVVKPRTDGHRKGISPTVTVVGWRWRPIAGLPVVDPGQHTTVLSSGVLGGQTYSPFIRQSSAGAFTSADQIYALDGNCTALDLTVGATPDSATNDYNWTYLYGYLVSAPSVLNGTIYSHSVQRDTAPIHVYLGPDLIAPLARIQLHSEFDVSGNAVGWGAAQVYCRS